jgi:predicted small secreted protein
MTKVRRFAILLSTVAVAVGVAGCGNTVSGSDIAKEAKTKFNQQFAALGKSDRITSVSCPKDLQAKVGASEVCSGVASPGNVKLNITATVDSVSGSTAHLHFSLSTAQSAPGGTTTS